MITRYNCALDGAQLTAIDESIAILDINENAPRMNQYTSAIGGRDGMFLSSINRQQLNVDVIIEVHEYSVERRQEIIQRILRWSRGKWLTIGSRPGQKIRVICTELPYCGSEQRWLDQIRMVFTAYMPYWCAENPSIVEMTRTSSGKITKSIKPCGDYKAYIECSIKSTGNSKPKNMTIEAGDKKIDLNMSSGLSSENGTVTIEYDENWLLGIRTGTVSRMLARSAESDDDLLVDCGADIPVSITSDQPFEAKIIVRGLYY